MPLRVTLLALPLLLATTVPAIADEDPDRQTDREIARRHYDRGVAFFDAQRYEQAAAEFEAARAVMPSPAFDYNLGKCYERLERWADAVAAFERFLAARPDDPDAPAKRERVVVLRRRVASSPATAPRAPDGKSAAGPPVPERAPAASVGGAPAPPRSSASSAGYALVGVGAASAVAGAVLLGLAARNASEVSSLYASGGTWTDRERALEAAGHTYDLAGPILIGAGAALAVTGTVLAIVGARHERAAAVSITPLPGGGAMVLACGF